MKTIGISEEVHRDLINLKLQEREKNADELIAKLIIEYKKFKFMEASMLFRKNLKEKNIAFSDVLHKSKKIREEIGDEWFSD